MNPARFVLISLIGLGIGSPGLGQELTSVLTLIENQSANSINESIDAGPKLDALITEWVLDAIPHHYDDTKHWGKQEEKHTRVRLRLDPGGKLETYRPREMVNHGDWSRFSAQLLEPEEKFQVQLKNIRTGDDGRMYLEVHCRSRLAIQARQARWVRGVQLYSVGAEGTSDVELVANCSIKSDLDLSRLPPDLVIDPHVDSTKIIVQEFKIDHFGKFGGEFAQQVTRLARNALDEQITAKETSLTEKINQKIKQNQSKLRFSSKNVLPADWIDQLAPHLPESVQNSLKSDPSSTSVRK